MLFDAPAIYKIMGRVRIVRKIRVTSENVRIVAKALGIDPKKKGLRAQSIYIVQEAPEVKSKSKKRGA